MTVLLTVEEAAEELRWSRAATAARIASGEIPSIKLGRSRRVVRSALVEWVERQARAQALRSA